jgi:hypothetical protein
MLRLHIGMGMTGTGGLIEGGQTDLPLKSEYQLIIQVTNPFMSPREKGPFQTV